MKKISITTYPKSFIPMWLSSLLLEEKPKRHRMRVCNNKRIYSHKTFAELAQMGKTSKLHLIVDDRGELVNFFVTPGKNEKYRCPTLIEAKEFQEFVAVANPELATCCDEQNLQWNSHSKQQQIESKVKILLSESLAVKYFRQDNFLRNIDLAIDIDLALDLVLNMEIDIDINTDHAIALACNFDHHRTFRHASATVSTSTSGTNIITYHYTITHTITYALAHDLDSHRAITGHRVCDLARALARFYNDEILQNFLQNNDFSSAQRYLQQSQPTNVFEQRRKILLTELLHTVTVEDSVKKQQAWYKYIGYLAEYAIIGYEELEREKLTWWQWLFFWQKTRDYTEEKEIMAVIYAYTKIIEARQTGELTDWEGIRIVQESQD